MSQAKQLIKAKFKNHWDEEMSEIEHECLEADRLLEQKQLKGRRTLSRRIKSLPKPKNRMSKQMISLMHHRNIAQVSPFLGLEKKIKNYEEVCNSY